MLVCVDHGNKQIKTASRVFTSGLVESDTRPPFGDNILFYRGKYYTLSDQRIPYTRDKTEDDRFFILTLFAIAYEINTAGQYVPDRLMNIQLAVGLPPAHYGTQYKRFAQYFLNRGVIGFEFNGRKYSICITEAVCFPQALAATAPVVYTLQSRFIFRSKLLLHITLQFMHTHVSKQLFRRVGIADLAGNKPLYLFRARFVICLEQLTNQM